MAVSNRDAQGRIIPTFYTGPAKEIPAGPGIIGTPITVTHPTGQNTTGPVFTPTGGGSGGGTNFGDGLAAAPATSRGSAMNFFGEIGSAVGVRKEGGGATLVGIALAAAGALLLLLLLRRRKKK